ncbi:MAG: hydrogenase maturation nickel metallochaperone HypA [Candidatus Rokuibacteriota bacterium]
MHELSVAQAIVESLAGHEALAGGARVHAVTVRVGALSGVVPAALRFAWGPATEGTFAAGSRLDLEEVALAAWCPSCRAERELPGWPHRSWPRLACPACGAPTPDVVRGRELEILAMEVEDSGAPPQARGRRGRRGP